jgi:hypothetical protein
MISRLRVVYAGEGAAGRQSRDRGSFLWRGPAFERLE